MNPSSAQIGAPSSQGTRQPLRVLLVEDDTLVGIGIKAQLQKLGHSFVGQAATASQARKLFMERAVDLVLMDIRLGEADGLTLAQQLLAERRVPMIVISAYSDPELIARAVDVGVFGYLIKPVSAESLQAQIEVAMRRALDHEALRAQRDELAQTLEARKFVEKAKGILMKRFALDENDAHRRLQKEAQKRRINIGEMARRVIESEELFAE